MLVMKLRNYTSKISMSLSYFVMFFLVFPKSTMGMGYMSTLSTLFEYACAIEAETLLPVCHSGSIDAKAQVEYYAISGGGYFTCGLTYKSRTPVCWGEDVNSTSKFGNISYSNLNSGAWHVCAIRADGSGSVDCWGNDYGQLEPPKGVYTMVTSGDVFTCGLSKNTSKSVCWGDRGIPYENQTSLPDPQAQYSAIFAGRFHVCGIEKETRKTLCWGGNDFNQSQPPTGYNFSAITCGYRHSCGIRDDTHGAVCWGDNSQGQLDAPDVSFSVISAGTWYTCGVRLDKPTQVKCWGGEQSSLVSLGLGYSVSEALCQRQCSEDQYIYKSSSCPTSGDKICLDCSRCAAGSLEATPCGNNTDRTCAAMSIAPAPAMSIASSAGKKSKSVLGIVVGVVISVVVVVAILLVVIYWTRLRAFFRGPLNPWEKSPESVEAFTSAELRSATANYSASMLLGRGAFGMVYKGLLQDGRVVAIKKSTNPERSKSFDQELQLLAVLHHTYLVNLVGYCKEEKLLVYEFMENGSLFDCLFGNNCCQLTWRMRIKIAAQASRGLEYLHSYASPSIIHRDVKSSNILLDKEWNARVSDFGLSLFGPIAGATHLSNLTVMGTPGYLDPEYFSTLQLTAKSDVYSFGVVLLELISGRKAIDQQQSIPGITRWVSDLAENNDLLNVFDSSLQRPDDSSPVIEALDLALQCVEPNGKDRPTMASVATLLDKCLENLVMTEQGSPLGSSLALTSEGSSSGIC